MSKAGTEKKPPTPDNKTKASEQAGNKPQPKPGEQARQGRAISDPREVAQLVMMRIDHVNSKKDELTIAVKMLADTAKQLAGVYAGQQAQIVKLAKRVEELEKAKEE
jgi:hypothetical protein